jgi:hypothetical protein
LGALSLVSQVLDALKNLPAIDGNPLASRDFERKVKASFVAKALEGMKSASRVTAKKAEKHE